MTAQNKQSELFTELCTGYVLGALDREEEQKFEEMLRNATDEQQQFYEEIKTTSSLMALATPVEEPTGDIKSRILQHARSSEKSEATYEEATSSVLYKIADILGLNRPPVAVSAAAALMIIVLSFGIFSFNIYSGFQDQQKQIEALQNQVQQKERMLSILGARDINVVILNGKLQSNQAYGKLLWDPVKMNAILQIRNLPETPKNKVYQLWLIRNNNPKSAALFTVNNDSNESFITIDKLAKRHQAKNATFAVTLEPKGGVPKPTGKIYLAGTHQED